ncbi:TetR/AcrR family transcriptional regulator [Methyloglobulus sp.]|uniref:TetR/AcrR family transcriptional regulator n=1 Tax=Methyloglobulus sp. TaxID=2518622 RepID=UPI0032B7ED19
MEQQQEEIQAQVETQNIEVQDKAETRDEILLAALKLFAEKGFFNTSLTEIAEAAGVKNTSAVYHHFKNKQAIATQLFANILDSLNISIDDIRRKNQKSSEQLRGIVDLLFKLTDDAPDVMRFLLILKLDEFLPEEKPMLETPAFIKIYKIIQSGIKAGEIRSIDPMLVNAYFFGIINNTLRMVLTGALDKNADAYQSQVWLAAWNAIAKK